MWDRECEVWGQKCDHLRSALTRGGLFLDSRDSPTRLARLRRGRYAREDGVGPAPSPGPPTNGIRCLAGAFHRPRRKVLQARRRPAAKASGMTAARLFGARSAVPEARSPECEGPLPARLGGGAHSSSRSRSSGGDSSGAPGRATFQRVCTSMPAGVRGPGSGAHAMHRDQGHGPGGGRRGERDNFRES